MNLYDYKGTLGVVAGIKQESKDKSLSRGIKKMSNADNRNDKKTQPKFIEGYFSTRFLAGEKPNYGYPANHLPKVIDKEIEMKTSFVEGLTTKD